MSPRGLASRRSTCCRRLCLPARRAGARTVGARTEHLTIARGGGDVQATVKRIEHLGDQSHLHLDLGGQPVVTLSDPEARLGAGDIVSLRLNKPLFFDADGGRVAA